MSSPEVEIDIPPPSDIEESFRAVIRGLYDAGDLDNLTVKRIRAAAEQQLTLPAGFFRHSTEWKDRSKSFIEAEVRAREAVEATTPASTKPSPTRKAPRSVKSSPVKNAPQSVKSTPSKQAAKKSESPELSRGKKRASADAKPVERKKRKTDIPSDADDGIDVEDTIKKGVATPATGVVKRDGRKIIDSDDDSDGEGQGVSNAGPQSAKKSTQTVSAIVPARVKGNGYQPESGDALSSPVNEPAKKKVTRKPAGKSRTPKAKATKLEVVELSESDASVIVDKSPKKKSGGKKSAPVKAKAAQSASPETLKQVPKEEVSESEMSSLIDEPPKMKRQKKSPALQSKSAKPKANKAATGPLDPQEAEIKKLQSWLIQCGIRKLWHRELASCSSSREKISHLKGLLKDAGMEGRFSKEKAEQIKERRELEADLEEVNQFATKYGSTERASRSTRAAMSMADLGFGSEDDGVETD